ncbi:hypothetical protein CRM22_000964 [Opisthorchis felineus]|uniref:Oxidative stress-responsive serine-rich protein 1 n=1 Tax=Opisthorchis felineus TaxID=147828 RepID=A0A4S2MCQ5_OPIFE|nr:hypothetical protein CRM22_000964 [Opisthorchis felineus]
MSSHLSTFAAGDNDEHSHNVSQPSVRCRRNSDPERWQQLRTDNTSKLKEVSRSRAKETTQTSSVQYITCHSTHKRNLQPTCADNSSGGSRPFSTLLDGLSLGFGFGDGHIVSRSQQFGTFKSPLYAASTEGRTLLTNADQFGMMLSNSPASVLPADQSSMGFISGPAGEHVVPSLVSGGANPNLLGSRSIFQSSQAPHTAQFSFRPSMLTQAAKMMEAEEQCSVIGDGGCRKRKCCLSSVSSPWTDDGVTPTATAPMDGFSCAPHTGHPVGQPSTTVESDSMFKSLQRELSTLEQNQQQDATESLSTGPNRQPMSDVSVNELAAYMEHMVHIPGRMSEMAQRMYL